LADGGDEHVGVGGASAVFLLSIEGVGVDGVSKMHDVAWIELLG
jgi:hypothetical protein